MTGQKLLSCVTGEYFSLRFKCFTLQFNLARLRRSKTTSDIHWQNGLRGWQVVYEPDRWLKEFKSHATMRRSVLQQLQSRPLWRPLLQLMGKAEPPHYGCLTGIKASKTSSTSELPMTQLLTFQWHQHRNKEGGGGWGRTNKNKDGILYTLFPECFLLIPINGKQL